MYQGICDTCGKEITVHCVGYANLCPDTREEKPTLNYCSDDCDPCPSERQLRERVGAGICDLCGKHGVTKQRGDKRVCFWTVVKDDQGFFVSCDSQKE